MILGCPKNAFGSIYMYLNIKMYYLFIYLYKTFICLCLTNLSLSVSLDFFSPFLSVPAPTGCSGADRHLCWSLPVFLQTNCLHQPHCSPWEPSMNPPLLYCPSTPAHEPVPSAHTGLRLDPHKGQSSNFVFHCEVQ